MRMLATGVLGVIVALASIVCFFSSICAVGGGWNGAGRAGYSIWALISLAVAIGGVTLIGKLNKS
jgi:hypothetical protein